jgi:hypothetical protein
MRAIIVAAFTSLCLAQSAIAADASCAARAAEKKLAGAAKTSFMTKCEADATAACESQAADRKLAGAARTSFVGKCVKDAVGQ